MKLWIPTKKWLTTKKAKNGARDLQTDEYPTATAGVVIGLLKNRIRDARIRTEGKISGDSLLS